MVRPAPTVSGVFDFLVGYVMGERSAARAATFARGAAAASVEGDLYDIHHRINRMLLVIDAMWALLKEQGYTDEHLIAKIRELDEADGVVDGMATPRPSRCGGCGAMVEPGRAACAFCGVAVTTPASPTAGI
jgi:hypothetical protein